MGLFKSKAKKAAELMATGSKGIGTVVTVADTGMTINDNPRIKLVFSVEPLDGGPVMQLEKTATVSRVQIPRQGDRYPVWYDPEDPKTWSYATVTDATGQQSLREMFGAAADSFVGMGGAPAATPAAQPAQTVDVAEQIKKLADLHAAGALTDEEFAGQKAKLLGQ